jgi:pantoate--beta-alanine ligase
MYTLDTIEQVKAFVKQAKHHSLAITATNKKPYRIALVPTMGALHMAHMALVAKAQQLADVTIVSIFVNPSQFSPTEDFEAYPRPLADDFALCRDANVDAVFVPTAQEMYPFGTEHHTSVTPPDWLTGMACGQQRPMHFNGVATVVLKLFNVVQPDVAVFGEKDAQQLAVLRWMQHDLNVPVVIEEHPLIREGNGPLQGVAMSSRNRYLTTPLHWEAARLLSNTLLCTQQLVQAGFEASADDLLQLALDQTIAQVSQSVANCFTLQYFMAVDADTFTVQATIAPPTRLLIAATIKTSDTCSVRLIDTLRL